MTPPIDRVVKQARLDKLIADGKFQEAARLAKELGVLLPRGVVDLQARRERQ